MHSCDLLQKRKTICTRMFKTVENARARAVKNVILLKRIYERMIDIMLFNNNNSTHSTNSESWIRKWCVTHDNTIEYAYTSCCCCYCWWCSHFCANLARQMHQVHSTHISERFGMSEYGDDCFRQINYIIILGCCCRCRCSVAESKMGCKYWNCKTL